MNFQPEPLYFLMIKKVFGIFFILSLLYLGFLIYTKNIFKEDKTNTDWKKYTNSELGFSFEYPSKYTLEEQPLSYAENWNTATLLTVYDPMNSSSYEFNVPVMRVIVQKQPIFFGQKKIFTKISEYFDWKLLTVPDFDGKLTTINNTDSIYIELAQGDAESAHMDVYNFIHKDLIFEAYFNTNDKYYKDIVQTIYFK